ncbi:ribosome silencing factor [Brevibacillus sp. SYP-B805]|uniref:ribosome silencing factor n=1 Tax=Brevibacillus sp. SYP-B805 TaxID=1578199 RepID=UPI0013ECBA3C|nr:ribosome silencing factor [Brevibacillus sp. SYP-B805]NGQ94175.1 ribosome silencing factor [Brevibacillus sp. SYP-B805]
MVKVTEDLARLAVKAAEEKKAENILVMDIRELSIIAEYFVICHGNNERQVQAIVTEIRDQAYKNGYTVRGIEGADEGRWVLVDLGDVVVHVFHREEREFYNIERLWSDARQVTFSG